jgi:hypothetical protein
MWAAIALSHNSEEGREEMKKQVLGFSTILSLLLVLTASVHAQSTRGRINIPFSFTVGQKTLPAGEYLIVPNRQDSLNIWTLEAKNGNARVVFNTIPVRARQTQEETKLVFYKYGDQYFLSQVWTAGDDTGRELHVKSLQQVIVKNGIRVEKVVITNAGN